MDQAHYLETKLRILKRISTAQAHMRGDRAFLASDELSRATLQILELLDILQGDLHQFTRGLRYSPNQHPAAGESIDFRITP